jgi:hypothetical protein
MNSVSMTATLGVGAVVGTIALLLVGASKDQILASRKDQASLPIQCKTCAMSTSIDQIVRKKALKSTRSADAQASLNKNDESVQAMVVKASARKPLGMRPVQRMVKNPLQRVGENPPEQLVEQSQSRRLRRADDPFESFN